MTLKSLNWRETKKTHISKWSEHVEIANEGRLIKAIRDAGVDTKGLSCTLRKIENKGRTSLSASGDESRNSSCRPGYNKSSFKDPESIAIYHFLHCCTRIISRKKDYPNSYCNFEWNYYWISTIVWFIEFLL